MSKQTKRAILTIMGFLFAAFAVIFGPLAEILNDKGDYARATFDLILALWCFYSADNI